MPELELLAVSDEAGVFAVKSKTTAAFSSRPSEYDADTLALNTPAILRDLRVDVEELLLTTTHAEPHSHGAPALLTATGSILCVSDDAVRHQ